MSENTSTVQTETRQGPQGEYDVQVALPVPAKPPADGAEVKKPIPDAADEGAKPAAKEGEVAGIEPEAEVEATPEQQEAKKQSKFQRRLDRQKTARVAAETEAKLLREQLAKLEAKPAEAEDPKEPKREQFEDYETYLRAVTKYDAEQTAGKALKTEREAREKAEQTSKATAGQDKLAKDWSEREQAFQATTKDYAEAVTEYVEGGLKELSDVARRAIVESEVGPQVLHHLATNEEDAERIAELSPIAQVKELGRLEAKMAKPAAKTGKLASDAPAPVSQTKTGASAVSGYREGMSDAEYREWRKSNGARWAR